VIETGAIQKLGCSFLFAVYGMMLSCIFCEILQVTGRKSCNFYTQRVFSAPEFLRLIVIKLV